MAVTIPITRRRSLTSIGAFTGAAILPCSLAVAADLYSEFQRVAALSIDDDSDAGDRAFERMWHVAYDIALQPTNPEIHRAVLLHLTGRSVGRSYA